MRGSAALKWRGAPEIAALRREIMWRGVAPRLLAAAALAIGLCGGPASAQPFENDILQRRISLARRHGAWADVRLLVHDTDGSPIAGAAVAVNGENGAASGKPETDAAGRAVLSRICGGNIGFTVSKEGYVPRQLNLCFDTRLSDDGQRWLVGDERVVELRRLPEPRPMLRRSVRLGRLPSRHARVGYDLLKDAFTPPFGDGEVADFEIFFYHADADILGKGDGPCSLRLSISPGDGTLGFSRVDDFPDDRKAPLRSPREYASEMIDYATTRGVHPHPKPWPDRAADAIRDGHYLFQARGRGGVLKVRHFDPSHFSIINVALEFLVNEEPGVLTLVPAPEQTGGDARVRGHADDDVAGAQVAATNAAAKFKPLIASAGADSAIFFGLAENGDIIPARYADRRLASMDGVRFLKIHESVAKVPDGAFEGSKDLLAVALHADVTGIGSRAFADCPNLNLVEAFMRDDEFDVAPDAFDGAGTNLTCVVHAKFRQKEFLSHGIKPWRRFARLGELKLWNNFVEGDFLFRREGSSVKLAKYLGRPVEILHVPEKAAGMPVAGVEDTFFTLTLSARNIVFPASLSTNPNCIRISPGRQGFMMPEAVFMEGGMDGLESGENDCKIFVVGPVRSIVSQWERKTAQVLPAGTRPEDVLGGALVETNGFLVLKREDSACILRHTDGNADAVEVPSEICGLPVTELESHCFAGRRFREISLPSSLRKIGFCAFAGLKECEAMEIPEGVEEIGGGAFLACRNLKSLTLPSSLRKIGYGAFEGMPCVPSMPNGAEMEGPASAIRDSDRIRVRASDAETAR